MKFKETQIAYIKGYAMAIQEMMYQLTGENSCAKSYDPVQIDDEYIHTYAFDLKEGGRHHSLENYNSIEDVTNCMLIEGAEWVKEYVVNSNKLIIVTDKKVGLSNPDQSTNNKLNIG